MKILNSLNFRVLAAHMLLFICLAFSVNAQDNAPSALPEGMTGADTSDPRAKLKPGLYDAGEAISGMKHLLLLKKPDVFQLGSDDPDNPRVTETLRGLGAGNVEQIPGQQRLLTAQLTFANSDLAFQGNYLFLGNFYGVNIYDISDPSGTKLITSLVCSGGQGDVSVHKNLLFMSVEMPNGRLDCGTQGFPPPAEDTTSTRRNPAVQADRFRGVRIFDISDIRNPKQVGAVQSCRGSHTHTLVVDPKDKENVYIYISGSSYVRPAEELAGCSGAWHDKDPNTSLFRIEVIKVPLNAPDKAEIVSMPRIFGDEETGEISAIDSGGSHGSETPRATEHCHDITVYSELGLAAGACSGNGILLDIKDPVNPKRIESVNDKNFAYWHSATFSNDGSKVVFTDEWGGGMAARCRANDPNVWGANAIFRLDNNKLDFAGYYKLPAAQSGTENCVAHNGSLIPVPGRDIKVQSWYQGGISIMDFTDPEKPFEIAYFDRGPVDEDVLIMAGPWSTYWYNGYIYSSEIARGLDVLELTPSRHLSQNEIAAAKTVRSSEFNVQNQERLVWTNNLSVAKAYIDQLERTNGLAKSRVSSLRKAIQKAESSKLNDKDKAQLIKQAANVEKTKAKNPADTARLKALAEVLKAPVL